MTDERRRRATMNAGTSNDLRRALRPLRMECLALAVLPDLLLGLQPLEVRMVEDRTIHLTRITPGGPHRIGEGARDSRDELIHLGHRFEELALFA